MDIFDLEKEKLKEDLEITEHNDHKTRDNDVNQILARCGY